MIVQNGAAGTFGGLSASTTTFVAASTVVATVPGNNGGISLT
jgi:hypothetical protein